MGRGGVERVISLLLPLYMEMGYRVILITEEEEDCDDYDIPKNVKRYIVPKINYLNNGEAAYRNRAHELRNIFIKEKTDTLCYHAATKPGLFYDLLVSKRLGIKLILSKHELFSQGMVKNLDRIQKCLNVYRLADKVIVLSKSEKLFWNTMSVDAFYIPNPFNFNIKMNNGKEKHSIVWVGRLDSYQKRYQDIVPIMKKVVDILPDAVLKVYGNSETYKDMYILKHMIAESGLEKNIEYCGYVSDVNEIYRDAKIHLVTSAYESFPMNIYESKIFGVPLVTYDMPYLEMLCDGKGYVAVRQRDTDKAARAVIDLLRDHDYWEKKANEALESSRQYDNIIVKEKWRAIFEDTAEDIPCDMDSKKEYKVILKTIVYHSSLGCENAEKDMLELRKLRSEKTLNEIKLKTLQEQLEVALYPYGNIGRNTKKFLERNDIKVKLAVDKNSKDSEILTVNIEKLKEIDCSKYLFVICSNRGDIYDELRKNIRKYVCENNIYDLYPDYYE